MQYLPAIAREAARVLSLMDREPFSPTHGCMDRTYWAWKFTDFAGARFQEGICYLAFLHATPFDRNPFHGSDKLLRWIAAGIDWWCSLQRRSGDFDEAYPYERSLAATAFTSFYVAEAQRFLEGALPAETDSRFRLTLERAGDWLVRNDETHGFLSNHLAAAAAALEHAHLVTGERRFHERGRYFIRRILGQQSAEGWYDEYGGPDPGYQTHGSFYLARYLELTDDGEVADSLERACDFIARFVHPDRSIGGEYASRNTQTYYPAAFEMLKARSRSASWIADTMRPAVDGPSAAGLGTVDIYNYFPMLNNHVFAYQAASRNEAGALEPLEPSSEPGSQHFPLAGLLKVRTERYDAIVSYAKGGVVQVFDRKARALGFSDSGYVGRLRDGAVISSQWAEASRSADVEPRRVSLEGSFYRVSRPVMKPLTFMAFRAFTLTLGRVGWIARLLKSLLVHVLTYRKRAVALRLVRRIEFSDDEIEIDDHLQGEIGDRVEELASGDFFTTIHTGSSKYFVSHALHPTGTDEPVDPKLLASGVRRRRVVRIPS